MSSARKKITGIPASLNGAWSLVALGRFTRRRTEMPNSSNFHVSWLIQRARSATLRQYAPGNKELIT